MLVGFEIKIANKYTWRPEFLEQKMSDFEDYLSGKYEYISKMDMLRDEREARQAHGLNVGQAIKGWNWIYND